MNNEYLSSASRRLCGGPSEKTPAKSQSRKEGPKKDFNAKLTRYQICKDPDVRRMSLSSNASAGGTSFDRSVPDSPTVTAGRGLIGTLDSLPVRPPIGAAIDP